MRYPTLCWAFQQSFGRFSQVSLIISSAYSSVKAPTARRTAFISLLSRSFLSTFGAGGLSELGLSSFNLVRRAIAAS